MTRRNAVSRWENQVIGQSCPFHDCQVIGRTSRTVERLFAVIFPKSRMEPVPLFRGHALWRRAFQDKGTSQFSSLGTGRELLEMKRRPGLDSNLFGNES